MTTLLDDIKALIAENGPITVEQYMQLALAHPELGYYMNRDPFGATGDFTTAPEISQMFGELIGLWAAEVWSSMGSPPSVRLIELGPGRGTLMSDALRAARIAPSFREALDVWLMETSPALAAIQHDLLLDCGAPVSWAQSFKDIPGGQILGPTFDYTHRLLDPQLAEGHVPEWPATSDGPAAAMPRVTDILGRDGLIEASPQADDDVPVGDLTREPLSFPADRDLRLQNLARADEGFLLALGYSSQRGYGRNHPFAGEIRFGEVEVEFMAEEVGFAVPFGPVALTECQMVNQFKGSATEAPCFTRGYGLAFGQSERKAMSMALVDRALRARELGEEVVAPSQDEEFVMSHSDNVQATGFVEHLKLPHYVDFQSELGLLRKLRREFEQADVLPDLQEAAE